MSTEDEEQRKGGGEGQMGKWRGKKGVGIIIVWTKDGGKGEKEGGRDMV